ncbi:hypothetical protein K461DRAFT_120664 [Myriangium duriaei CBS 260.36]|uniref:Uncharacterized protein n=1 Tax=Myriangium duriaei CBS 260.36 TaxID=1168546 RepID=A0A9P4MGU6_9PEZI|nr:hypothetical protein K461DRAFT_120664 [Myriangium duriaei CBS 260.36]
MSQHRRRKGGTERARGGIGDEEGRYRLEGQGATGGRSNGDRQRSLVRLTSGRLYWWARLGGRDESGRRLMSVVFTFENR